MDRRPAGLIALSGFFVCGAAIASATFLALRLPGRGLEPMWRLNPEAHAAFLSMGAWAQVLMLAVAGACALAGLGLWRRVWWGHRLAVGLLTVNLLGDAATAVFRGDLRTLIGLPIGGALIAYLLSARVRAQFATTNAAA